MRAAIVVAEDLPTGLVANTAAVLAISIGRRYDIVGPDLADGSGSIHRGLTTIPLPVLKASRDLLRSIRDSALADASIEVVDVTDAAQSTTNYPDYEVRLSRTSAAQLSYLGVAVCGTSRSVRRLTGSLPLFR